MALAFRAIGTTSKVQSGNLTSVGLPTGHTTNDILMLFTIQQDNVNSTVSGYTNITGGTANNGTNCRIMVFAKRDGGSESAPTVTHAAGGISNAVIMAISGVDSGLTIGVGAGAIFRDAQNQTGSSTASGQNITAPALTGVVSGDFRTFFGGFTVNDTSGATTANWGVVSGFTERLDDCSDLTGAWGVSLGIDTLLSAGSAGSITSAEAWAGTFTTFNWVGSQLALSSDTSGGGLPPGQATFDSRLPFKAQTPRTWRDIGYMDGTETWLFTGKDIQFGGPGQWKTYDYPNPTGLDSRSKAWPVVSLRTFTDPMRPQLIDKDAQFGGPGQWKAYDYPNPRGPTPGISLRTWLDNLKMYLTGKDVQFGGAGQWKAYDWPLPVRRVATTLTHVGNWLQNTLAVQVALPFSMDDWPNPTGEAFAVGLRTFLNNMAQTLTGQDTFFGVPGQPISFNWTYVFSKDRRFPINLRSWSNSLASFLPAGVVTMPFDLSEWPNPIGEAFAVGLRTFLNNMAVNLTGQDTFFGSPGQPISFNWTYVFSKDRRFPISLRSWSNVLVWLLAPVSTAFPFSLEDWPNPRGAQRAVELLTQAGNWLQNTLGIIVVPFVGPFAMSDWITPILRPRRKMTAGAMQPPVGQDTMGGAPGQARTYDWPNPRGPISVDLRSWMVNIVNLLTLVVTMPFSLDHWPNPIIPFRRKAGKYGFRNINLGLDKFFGEAGQPPIYHWPNPMGRVPSIDLRSWFNNLVNTTLSGPFVFPFSLEDWPNPRGYLANISLRTWLDSLKTNLIAQDFLPFSMDDWPNPRGWPPLLRTWFINLLEGTLGLPVFTPFNMLDWPNPREYLRSISLRTWLDDLKIRLIGADTLPFGLDDWPNPVIILRSIDLRTWLQNLSRFAPLVIPPFFLTEWPVPSGKQFAIALRTFVDGVRLNLIGRDLLPFNVSDWPVPKVRLSGIDLRTFIDRLRMQLAGQDLLPFFQSNWPVPRGYARAVVLLIHLWDPIYQIILSIIKLPVGKTAYQATIHGILFTNSTVSGSSGFMSAIEASTAYGNAP